MIKKFFKTMADLFAGGRCCECNCWNARGGVNDKEKK